MRKLTQDEYQQILDFLDNLRNELCKDCSGMPKLCASCKMPYLTLARDCVETCKKNSSN